MNTTCFKAYDIRGQVPDELNETIAYRIGYAFVSLFKANMVVVGQDMRLESPSLAVALMNGITDAGANVKDLGLCGTEEVYFATFHENACGGIMVTASHNPKGYNGMKFVKKGAVPISGDTGLLTLKAMVEADEVMRPEKEKGTIEACFSKEAYIQHLLNYVNVDNLRPLKILADPGNGMAGPIILALQQYLPFEWVMINEVPDGHFPNGVPNPLLPENRSLTEAAILEHGCDLGLAWDGDFDRCFFYDATGRFIEGYYLVGLLAEMLLKRHPGERVIHDPRLTWNTIEQVQRAGGTPIQSKTGHAFIKERMRAENALYGGEMSAHHYFRDFAYSDSGMIPWLLITALMSETGKSLAALVNSCMQAYPCSGEMNYKVANVSQTIQSIEAHFKQSAIEVDFTDGLSMVFEDWRFNLRGSNTEPLLRLNVESKGEQNLVDDKVKIINALIEVV